MHYSTGLGIPASVGGAGLVAERAGAAPLAQILLEMAGALFALYLTFMLTLAVTGVVLRRRGATEGQTAAARVRAASLGKHAR